MPEEKQIGIGLLGFGTVGQGVWKHIASNREALESRMGVSLNLVKAGVKNLGKKRDVKIPKRNLTDDLESIVRDPKVDIVCELMGGTDEARALTELAFKLGKTVVTANKALICSHGDRLFKAAQQGGGHYFFEASVAGGIPVIKAIQEGLVANRFPLIFGILNGTSNYILTRMEREGISFDATLDDARSLGYVEADESLDLDGVDAAHKSVILTYLAHGKWVKLSQMLVDGIRDIRLQDIQVARELGYKIKLIASIQTVGSDQYLAVSVLPSLISTQEVVANVDEVYNAVSIHGDVVGTNVMIGRGAGQDATASSVISDIADGVRSLMGAPIHEGTSQPPIRQERTLAKLEDIQSRYYIRLKVVDQPGVLARLTAILGEESISVATVNQLPDEEVDAASLYLTTHMTDEAAIQNMKRKFKRLRSIVLENPVVFRIFEP